MDISKKNEIEILEPSKTKNFVNLPPTIDKWRYYDVDSNPVKRNAKGYLRPKKYGGLSYKIYEYTNSNTCVIINTAHFGKVKIYISGTVATITNKPTYTHGDY